MLLLRGLNKILKCYIKNSFLQHVFDLPFSDKQKSARNKDRQTDKFTLWTNLNYDAIK